MSSNPPGTAAGIPYEGTDITADEAVEAVKAVRAKTAAPLFHNHSITATLHGEGCEVCLGEGLVCESHPKRPWNELPDGCLCDAGMPCPRCTAPVPGCRACEVESA